MGNGANKIQTAGPAARTRRNLADEWSIFLRSRAEELENEKNALSSQGRATAEEKDDLLSQLREKSEEIKKVKAELRMRKSAINASVLSGLTDSSVLSNLTSFHHGDSEASLILKCSDCGEVSRANMKDRHRLSECSQCGSKLDPKSAHLVVIRSVGSSRGDNPLVLCGADHDLSGDLGRIFDKGYRGRRSKQESRVDVERDSL